MAQINPQFENIGKQFAEHYYRTYDTDRSQLAPMYIAESMMTFEGDNFQGQQLIVQKLVNMPFKTVKHEVVKIDSQPNPFNNGVITFVTGNLKVDEEPNPLKFAQIFHLAPHNNSYVIINDMFRLNIG